MKIAYLDEEYPHNHKLHDDPTDVEEVKLPRERIDPERVDVRVERTSRSGQEPEKSNALGTDGIR